MILIQSDFANKTDTKLADQLTFSAQHLIPRAENVSQGVRQRPTASLEKLLDGQKRDAFIWYNSFYNVQLLSSMSFS